MGKENQRIYQSTRNGMDRREFMLGVAALGLSATSFSVFVQSCNRVQSPVPVPSPPAPEPFLPKIPSQSPSPEPSPSPFETPEPAPLPLPAPVPGVDTDSDVVRIAHLLRRAGFGAGPEEMDRFISMGLEATVDYLIEYQDADTSDLEHRLASLYLNLENFIDLQRWWLLRMIYGQRPLQEKMAFFWHGLLTSSFRKAGQGPYMYDQNQLFREQAMGRYDVLLKAVSRDPAMLLWLDSQRNK